MSNFSIIDIPSVRVVGKLTQAPTSRPDVSYSVKAVASIDPTGTGVCFSIQTIECLSHAVNKSVMYTTNLLIGDTSSEDLIVCLDTTSLIDNEDTKTSLQHMSFRPTGCPEIPETPGVLDTVAFSGADGGGTGIDTAYACGTCITSVCFIITVASATPVLGFVMCPRLSILALV